MPVSSPLFGRALRRIRPENFDCPEDQIGLRKRFIMPELMPVLLAEDNPQDAFLIRRALASAGARNPVHVVPDGQQAIDYLAGTGSFADRTAYPWPALFLLDLRLPVKDGLEVLRWIHERPAIPQSLPVVVLSSVELPSETQQAYAMDIAACLVKPLGFDEMRERMRILKEYWLDPLSPS